MIHPSHFSLLSASRCRAPGRTASAQIPELLRKTRLLPINAAVDVYHHRHRKLSTLSAPNLSSKVDQLKIETLRRDQVNTLGSLVLVLAIGSVHK